VRSVSAYEVYLKPGKGAILERDEEGAVVVRRGTAEELTLPAPGLQAAHEAAQEAGPEGE